MPYVSTETAPVLTVEKGSLLQVTVPSHRHRVEDQRSTMDEETDNPSQASKFQAYPPSGPFIFEQGLAPERILNEEGCLKPAVGVHHHQIQASESCTTIESGPLSFRKDLTESEAGSELIAVPA